jgi:hypothetical protein
MGTMVAGHREHAGLKLGEAAASGYRHERLGRLNVRNIGERDEDDMWVRIVSESSLLGFFLASKQVYGLN